MGVPLLGVPQNGCFLAGFPLKLQKTRALKIDVVSFQTNGFDPEAILKLNMAPEWRIFGPSGGLAPGMDSTP